MFVDVLKIGQIWRYDELFVDSVPVVVNVVAVNIMLPETNNQEERVEDALSFHLQGFLNERLVFFNQLFNFMKLCVKDIISLWKTFPLKAVFIVFFILSYLLVLSSSFFQLLHFCLIGLFIGGIWWNNGWDNRWNYDWIWGWDWHRVIRNDDNWNKLNFDWFVSLTLGDL